MEQPLQQKKQRIEYIDLMKGFLMTFIMIIHCQLSFPNEYIDSLLRNIMIPLYFLLSGLFFKEYGSFKIFITKKINSLVIPYIFLSIFPHSLIYFRDMGYEPDIFTMIMAPYNFPLWFVRCLFFTYIFYYIFIRLTKRLNNKVRFVLVWLIALAAWIANKYMIDIEKNILPLHILYVFNIITAIVTLPFFYIASWIKEKGLLTAKFKILHITILAIIMLFIGIYTSQNDVEYYTTNLGHNFLFLYISAFSGTYVIWYIAYMLKRLIIFSNIGKYSLIVLGIHVPVIIMLTYNTTLPNQYVACITFLLMTPLSWIIGKLFPYFTAQKDLFYCDAQGKLHWGWNRK